MLRGPGSRVVAGVEGEKKFPLSNNGFGCEANADASYHDGG